MSGERWKLPRVFLALSVWLPIACSNSSDGTSESAQLQLYQLVLSTALKEAEVDGAAPQIQLNAVRVTPDGVPFPGDDREHYSPETSRALIWAAESLAGVTLVKAPAGFDTRPPAEIFVFSNPTFSGDSAATVGVGAARLTTAAYWGDAWLARLRWEDGQWVLSEWVHALHEDGGGASRLD